MLLLKIKIENWPIIVTFYKREIILILCMAATFLFSIKLKQKCFKLLALIAIIILLFNLVGFDILLKVK